MSKKGSESKSASNLYRLLAVAIVILLILGTGVLVITASPLQSPRITGSSISIVDTGAGGKPTPAHSVLPMEYTETDLAAIQTELPFTILTPQNLPESTTLASVRSINSRVEGLGVELSYITPDGQFTLTESKPKQAVKVNVERSQVLQEVDINGQPGVIYDPGRLPETIKDGTSVSETTLESRAILQWTDGTRWFELRGGIGSTEMLEIARSLAP